jgi:hypothetical protein
VVAVKKSEEVLIFPERVYNYNYGRYLLEYQYGDIITPELKIRFWEYPFKKKGRARDSA